MKFPTFSRFSRRHSRRGFTLMEMIIVLTIIALLVALAVGALAPVGEIAKRQATQANISSFRTALLTYQLNCGTLPTNDQGLKALWSRPTAEPIPAHWSAVFDKDEGMDPWNHPYIYRNPGRHNPGSYDVFSMGPDGLPDTDDDIGNWKDASTSSTP